MIDARAMRFETLRYSWDDANPLSGSRASLEALATREVLQSKLGA